MLSKTEYAILKLLFDDLTRKYTMREMALILELPYPQIHRSISSLFQKKLIHKEEQGKSMVISLVLEELKEEYSMVELERKKELLEKYSLIKVLVKDLETVRFNQFIIVIFGSHAEKKAKTNSDIDILLVIPEEYDYETFEKAIKHALTLSKVDLNITTEKGLLEMWSHPLKLNVGNEILKKHVVLLGAEAFLRLRRKFYVG